MGYDRQYWQGIALCMAIFLLPAITGGMAWLYFITPLPVIFYLNYLGFERGFKIIAQAALAAGIIALFFRALPTVLFSLSLLPVGYIMARGLSRKEPVQQTLLLAVLTLGTVWFLTGFMVGAANHINLYSEVLKNIDLGLANAYEAYRQSPEINFETQLEFQQAFQRIRELIPRIFPGILVNTTISMVWFNAILANWLLKKRGVAGWDNFKDWRLPEPLVWPLIACGLLVFSSAQSFDTLGLNGLIILGTLYFLQGLAVMTALFTKWSVPGPIRFMVTLLLIIQAYGFILIALLGLADVWADFRKPKPVDLE